MKNDIGIIIKQARLQKGFTQEVLAEKVGVKKSAVAKWENGRVSEIKRSNLKNLADALGLNPALLVSDFSGEDMKKPTAADDGLSEDMQKLIDRIKELPPDKVQMLLQVAESIR